MKHLSVSHLERGISKRVFAGANVFEPASDHLFGHSMAAEIIFTYNIDFYTDEANVSAICCASFIVQVDMSFIANKRQI